MDITVKPVSVSYRGEQFRERVRDNSTELAVGGGAGAATFGVVSNSSKIGNSIVRALNKSKIIKAEKQTQLLDLIAKGKFAKFAKNPIVVKGAGLLAGMSAVTSLVGSTAKIADTYGYLSSQNPEA